MSIGHGWARLGVAVLLASALAACTNSPDRSSGRPPAPGATASTGIGVASSAATTPAPATSSSSGAAAVPSANVTKKVAEAQFHLPSQNIGCYVSADSARCDVAKRSWTLPPKPANCELDWGFGAVVSGTTKATLTCAGDTVLGGPDELAYGRSLQAGDMVCDSRSTGVRCTNLATKHGFALSAQKYELF
ncbi:DUF6636 domain-containing protein [Krasilnikovia sp. MM14-A1259]|uniref:DUF6636 domain-containing protein n=1 Tax=Krasilnikovia sp. MM14-A1259 TaxID=3373539 RepID=UPI0037F73CAE